MYHLNCSTGFNIPCVCFLRFPEEVRNAEPEEILGIVTSLVNVSVHAEAHTPKILVVQDD